MTTMSESGINLGPALSEAEGIARAKAAPEGFYCMTDSDCGQGEYAGFNRRVYFPDGGYLAHNAGEAWWDHTRDRAAAIAALEAAGASTRTCFAPDMRGGGDHTGIEIRWPE